MNDPKNAETAGGLPAAEANNEYDQNLEITHSTNNCIEIEDSCQDLSSETSTTLKVAHHLVERGSSVVPIHQDGSKRPGPANLLPKTLDDKTGRVNSGWKTYQERPPAPQELDLMFGVNGTEGIGIVCGRVSGNLEVFDFDTKYGPNLFPKWAELVEAEAPGLVQRLVIEPTPGVIEPDGTHRAGTHVFYRCPEIEIPGSQKLAMILQDTSRPKGKDNGLRVMIETRGEGSYVVVHPTPACYHTTNKPYGPPSGDIANPPTVTAEEREIMLRAARSLTQIVDDNVIVTGTSPSRNGETPNGNRPGDDYNARASNQDILNLLEQDGWKIVKQVGDSFYVRRPGKNRGWSATVGFQEPGLLHVFSSNAWPFEPDRAYRPFAVYALLKHSGDFSAAAKELAANGYGDLDRRDEQTTTPTIEIISPDKGAVKTLPATLENLLAEIAVLGDDREALEDWALDNADAVACLNRTDTEKFGLALKRSGLPSSWLNQSWRSAVKEKRVAQIRTQVMDFETRRYDVIDNRLCHYVIIQGDGEWQPLANFNAQITANILRDDGSGQPNREIEIDGVLEDGSPLPPIVIPSSDFESMNWVVDRWGARARIESGRTVRDNVRNGIQYMSIEDGLMTDRYIYTHMGWREIDGKHVYLTASGALGGQGIEVEVELEPELRKYALPLVPEDPMAAMNTSLRFLGIGPPTITYPLWAAMYAAPLSEIMYPDFVISCEGPSGSKKSTTVALALNHFGGPFTETELPADWLGTENSLEKFCFLAKDAPFVIDDYKPTSDSSQNRKLEAAVTRIIRHVGNHQGRTRMRADTSLQTTYKPRGLVISTGEQGIRGVSTIARTMSIEFNPNDINVERLTEAQMEAHRYPDAMSGYILWLAEHWEELERDLPEEYRRVRAMIQDPRLHARLPGAMAKLYIAFNLAMQYAQEIEVVTEEEAREHINTLWEALHELTARQSGRISAEKPAELYLATLVNLLIQQKVHLSAKHVGGPNKGGNTGTPHHAERVGWYDTDAYVYLLPGAYNVVSRYARAEGWEFPINERALRKELLNDGYLITTNSERLTTRARDPLDDQKSIRTLKIKLSTLESIAESFGTKLPTGSSV